MKTVWHWHKDRHTESPEIKSYFYVQLFYVQFYVQYYVQIFVQFYVQYYVQIYVQYFHVQVYVQSVRKEARIYNGENTVS